MASAMCTRLQPASAPSLFVTPFTASAASSAIAARAIRSSALGSQGSFRSSGAASRGGSKLSGRPPKGSSGTTFAIATARSASAAKPFGSASVEETIAWRLPTKTRRPRSKPSDRSSCSILPSRRETESEASCTSSASAASAPARFAAATRSERRSSWLMRQASPRWRAGRAPSAPGRARQGSGRRGTCGRRGPAPVPR